MTLELEQEIEAVQEAAKQFSTAKPDNAIDARNEYFWTLRRAFPLLVSELRRLESRVESLQKGMK